MRGREVQGKGGGIQLFIKDKVKVVPYIPVSSEEYKEVDTERIWALATGTDTKIAIGFVYAASTSVPGHVNINKKLYKLLREEGTKLAEEGFKLLFMGDFNGHLGKWTPDNSNGVEVDMCEQNQNGKLLLDFTELMELEKLNNSEVCKGKFTRVEGGRVSIVDFGLSDPVLCHRIKEFNIDEGRQWAQGSDHCVLGMKIVLNNFNTGGWKEADI